MSRQFLAFLTQLALIVAAVAAVLYILKVDPEVIKLVVAGGVGVLALVALIAALSRLPLRRGEAKKDDGARARRADLRRRARRLRRRIQDAKLGHWLWRRSAAAAPLWLVIGPAGHGRSTLLAAAPGAQERAAKDHEPGQPRFFTTSDAAFIELPESFDADPGYRTLLRALARRWPRQPIAGVLVVARLDALDDDDSRTLLDPAAKLLRRLAADLSVRPPVMLAWTHLDQIPGIAELCHGLSSTDHPLGATLPAYNTPEALLSALEARLHEPRGWIHQRAHALLCRSASASEQANLYGLWQHLDHLLTRAAAAAARLVAQPLVGGELLQLRGLYLLAPLTAPASPRWFESLAQRVGGAYTDEAAPPRPAQLFVQEFFRTELIRDSALAARLRPFLWRRASVHALVAVAAAGLSVYASRAILSAADAERAAMQRTADAARHAPVAPTRQPLPRPDLLQLWRETQRWRAPPDGLADWGLFRGDLLAGPASRLFTRAACNGLIYPLTVESEQILRQLSRRYPTTVPSPADQRALDDHLQFYTLTTDPDGRCAGQPALLGRQLQMRWTDSALPDDPFDDNTLQSLTALLTSCRAAVNAHPWDPTLAQSVQEILNRTAPEEQILRDLIQRLNSDPGLNHIDLINPGLRGGSPVPRAFTAPAWAKASAFISEHSSARGADCHRRAADTEQRETYCRRLSDGYMLKYRNAWAHAFKALQTDPGNNLRELQESISTLAEPNDNPLQNVFDLIDENTQRLPTISCRTSKELAATAMRQRSLAVAQDPEADPARRIAQYFAPLLSYARTPPPPKGTKTPKKKSPSSLPIDDYKSHLTKLLPAIKAAIDNPEQLTPLAESAKRDLDQIVYQIDVGNYGLWREPLKDLLLPPFKQIIVDATDAAAIKLNKDWCDEVILPMRQSLVGRYPFVADSKQNASLAELDKYFHPEKGAIARFRDTHLASRLEISPTGVRARPVALGAERHLTDTLVDFLDDAHKLGILLYDDAQQIGVDLTMLPTCAQLDPSRRNEIHRLTLDLGGGEDDKHSFICSTKNTSRPFRWPGKESEKSPTILLVVGKETGEDKLLQAGAFGLFRLLERRPPRRREHSHTLIAIHPFLKYGDVELEYIPTLRQGGTLFFGFDRTNTRFLAPLRTRALVTPPSQIFREIDFTCGSAP